MKTTHLCEAQTVPLKTTHLCAAQSAPEGFYKKSIKLGGPEGVMDLGRVGGKINMIQTGCMKLSKS